MKSVLIIVSDSPFNTSRVSEAFRMGIGLTMSACHISLLLIHDGVYNLLPLRAERIDRPGILEYIRISKKVGLHLLADADSLKKRKISLEAGTAVQLPRDEIFQAIRKSDVVIPFR